MKNPRNSRPHTAGERKRRKVPGRTSFGAEVRAFLLCVLLVPLLPRCAVAQIVRGTLIDAPPSASFPATNKPPLSQTLTNALPASSSALDGKSVFIKGFMMPMNYQSGFTTNCVLLRNQSLCCFGIPPRINEWVVVRMTGKSIEVILDRPVTIFGKLHVGEYRENGRLLRSIYLMDGEKMEGPDDFK